MYFVRGVSGRMPLPVTQFLCIVRLLQRPLML
jgi:hypothetical protein